MTKQEQIARRIASNYRDSKVTKNGDFYTVEWSFDLKGIPAYKAFVSPRCQVIYAS